MSNKLHVKKDDTVLILSGDDKGKQGKVVEVSPKEGKVIVSGVNVVSKHVKPRRQGPYESYARRSMIFSVIRVTELVG